MSSAWMRSFIIITLIFLLTAGAHGERVCTVRSSKGKEVHIGSSFTVSCVFSKKCTKIIYQDENQIKHVQFPNASAVSVEIKNLTESSIFTCRCKKDPEPCGIDITPGYPPGIPQNLTCVQETEFGNVSCEWRTGRDTKITTTCQLRVQGETALGYKYVMDDKGLCSVTFPIISSMSQFIVWLNVSNSLGTQTSGPHSFTLSNIVKPSRPNITHVNCSSRLCVLHTNHHSISLAEVQYRTENESWKNLECPDAQRSLTVKSLQPFTMYEFQIRRKINYTVGLWSDWSQMKVGKTQEEAPDKVLDVWFLEESKSKSENKSFQIFWKKLSKSDAKGKIQGYNITFLEQKTMKIRTNIVGANISSHIINCTRCSVSVTALNSKGRSPGNFIDLRSPKQSPGTVSHKALSNHSAALFWRLTAGAGQRIEYVVHWYPVGHKEKLKWIRVFENTTILTGLHPKKCYQVGVTALLSAGPVMALVDGISTWQSAPEQGPDPQKTGRKKTGESLQVEWSEIPHEKRCGCLKMYTIYLDNLKGKFQNYSVGVDHPKVKFTITGLSSGHCYKLWVTAWTDAGEGPKGADLPFCTPSDHEKLTSFVVLSGGAVLLTCLILLCVCQFSSVQRRFLSCCQCLLPRVIPDPANSKWAKECAVDQGEMKFHLHGCDSSMEEEPDTVEVEEVPYQSTFTCTYIKSLSQESSSSDATQITKTSDITDDYISTHGAISGEEEGEEEEEEILDEFGFFPCTHNSFLEPLITTGGKLTLDAVKIDCSEFLDCT